MTQRGEKPDTLVLSLTNWNLWRRNARLSNYIWGGLNTNAGGSQITEQAVAAAFRLKRILIAEASVNVALKGKTVSLANVYGDTYAALLKTGLRFDAELLACSFFRPAEITRYLALGGDVLTVKGRGITPLRGTQRGDLRVGVHVVTPTRLDARQEELLRELRAEKI